MPAREVFVRLVSVSDETDDTRRRVRRTELEGLGVDPRTLETVIDAFGSFRLLSFDRDPVTRGPTVEVAHEALIREWPRYRHWIDERRDDLRAERRLESAATEWLLGARDPSFLVSGVRLETLRTVDRLVARSPDRRRAGVHRSVPRRRAAAAGEDGETPAAPAHRRLDPGRRRAHGRRRGDRPAKSRQRRGSGGNRGSRHRRPAARRGGTIGRDRSRRGGHGTRGRTSRSRASDPAGAQGARRVALSGIGRPGSDQRAVSGHLRRQDRRPSCGGCSLGVEACRDRSSRSQPVQTGRCSWWVSSTVPGRPWTPQPGR